MLGIRPPPVGGANIEGAELRVPVDPRVPQRLRDSGP